jgi:hypothetical protein
MNTLNSISLGELYKQMFKATIRLLIIIHGVPKNNFPNNSKFHSLSQCANHNFDIEVFSHRPIPSQEVTRACFPSLCKCHRPGV